MISRESALELLHEYTKSESLRKHGLAVETVMRAYARHYGEDEEKWGLVGLLHDFDYEKYPDPKDHPLKGSEILREHGYPEEIIYAIQCHADYLELERKTPMDKSIFACDELSGFVIAVALVRPNKKLSEVTVKSVKKKLKNKGFAQSVIRPDIYNGVEVLGVDLDQHIDFVIKALQANAEALGL